jgi:acyl-CoA reductase-like NAD-dependent aldehyde dehydrogenase
MNQALSETQIESLIDQVMARIQTKVRPQAPQVNVPSGNGKGVGVFNTIDEAVDHACAAFQELSKCSLQQRSAMIANIRRMIKASRQKLAQDIVTETGMGRVEDKVVKLDLVVEKTPGTEDIEPLVYSGDHGLTLTERAPFGVIGSVTPVTNPVDTVVCNAIGFLAGGNTAVFNAHPRAKNVCRETVQIMNHAVLEAQGPPNVFCTVSEPTIESAKALMTHPGIRLLVVTGGPGVVKEAMRSGKRAIAAGPGNPPVVVDSTADLDQAARDIVFGASLDNNIICVLEKEIIVVESIADKLLEKMQQHKAVKLSSNHIRQLESLLIDGDHPKTEWVGQDAEKILKQLGIQIPNTRLLVAEVSEDHPFVQIEMLMPVIPLVRVKDVQAAIDCAYRCEHGFYHTAVIHSKNIDVMSEMARRMNVSIFVKNAPTVAGLGYQGEGFTSFTIAGPTGEGMTRARTFTRERRCTLKGHFRII